jgi:hypothetical protein
MTTKTDVFNSYQVQFVFDYCVITSCVFAMSEEAAVDIAADTIVDNISMSPELFRDAQEINIELLDRDVL